MSHKVYAKSKAVSVRFRVQGMDYGTLNISSGLRCVRIDQGGTAGKYFLDEFPRDIFPSGSMILHDASHYGIVLEPSEVETA